MTPWLEWDAWAIFQNPDADSFQFFSGPLLAQLQLEKSLFGGGIKRFWQVEMQVTGLLPDGTETTASFEYDAREPVQLGQLAVHMTRHYANEIQPEIEALQLVVMAIQCRAVPVVQAKPPARKHQRRQRK